ncbi:MAG: diguanylate cyclase [Gammaproteobacteria bacterium]|nr:diguanylate cyclase [Gammaproteobacteria bacterium]
MLRNIPITRSISMRLLARVFTIYFTITIFITFLHIVLEYSHTKKAVLEELEAVDKTFTPALRTALWEINHEQLQSIADGIVKLPTIVALVIEDNHGKTIIESGDYTAAVQQETRFYHQFHITQTFSGEEIFLANATFYTSKSVVIDRIIFGFTIILLNAAVKSFILLILILWAFRVILFYPLRRLTQKISAINLDKIDTQQIHLGLVHDDELKLLEQCINHMLTKIGKQKRMLIESNEKYQQNLERQVKERTHELAEANQRLSYFATTDPLTNILNRRSLFEYGERDLTRARRNGQPISVLMMDLDHFKAINDNYGHAAGDAVLIAFTTSVQETLRESDLFARYGGEEFLLLLTDTDIDGASKLGEKIRQAVERQVVHFGDQQIRITISIGIAALNDREESLESIISRSDRELYRAKIMGRNRCCTPETEP